MDMHMHMEEKEIGKIRMGNADICDRMWVGSAGEGLSIGRGGGDWDLRRWR